MATQALPNIPTVQTDLNALIAAFAGGNNGSSSSSSGMSASTPAFLAEMKAYLDKMGTDASPYSKQNAIADMDGVISNLVKNKLQAELPSIAAVPRRAGAYNSTTKELLTNDLAARTQAEASAALVQNILNYAQIEQGYANALANMARAGTSSVSNQSSQQSGANNAKAAQSAALAKLGTNALGGLLSKFLGGGSGSLGITDIMGMPNPGWSTSLVDSLFGSGGATNDYFIGGANLGDYSAGLPGYGYGGTSGGITDYVGIGSNGGGSGLWDGLFSSGSGGGFFDSLTSGIGDFFGGIGDTISDWFSFADGGKIPGKAPADRTKDNVTIKARSGEHVIIPEAVEALGEDFFDKINAAFMPKELRKEAAVKKSDPARTDYATGGMVGLMDPNANPFGEFSSVNPANVGGLGFGTTMPSWNNTADTYIPSWSTTIQAPGTYQGEMGQLTRNIDLPTQRVGNAPVYDFSNPGSAEYAASAAALQAGNSMSAGWQRYGVNAFLDGDLNFMDFDWDSAINQWGDDQPLDVWAPNARNIDYYRGQEQLSEQLKGLANAFGYDISGYNMNDWGRYLGFSETSKRNMAAAGNDTYASNSARALFESLNNDLKDYMRIRTASAGWDGRGDLRSTAETLYYQESPGRWIPVSNSKFDRKAEHKGWAREDGAETIAAISMMLPAVGGFAGMFGMPASSTAGMLTNAVGNYALTGNPASLIGAVGGYGGGQLANAFGVSQSLGSTIGSNLLKQMYAQSQQKK